MNHSTSSISMPGAPSPVALPAGWVVTRQGDPLLLAGPESDLKLAFLTRPVEKIALDDLVHHAWQEVEPGFDVPVRQRFDLPPVDGWDSVTQIAYDPPENQSRTVVAIVRLLGGNAYLTLIDGSKAALSRRMAQVAELNNGWKPAGLKETNLRGTVARQLGDAERESLNSFITFAMGKIGVPGVAIAVVQDGRTVLAEGFGVRRLGEQEPVTAATRFMIGSSTKPLTTLMMARLVDMGRFTWTTPVIQVLPGFALADREITERVQMRHTVCACTGMPRRDTELVFRFRGVRPEDRLAEMKGMSPTTGFGEIFQYSNYLVAAGGYAAAHSYAPDLALNEAYEKAMQQLIFEPLGMRQTSVLNLNSPLDAAPHGRDLSGKYVPIDPELEGFADAVAPAGSVWSNVHDIARYLLCELQQGLNQSGTPIVSRENLLARRRSAVKIDGKTSYGLGLLLAERQGLTEAGHGGNTRGFTSEMIFFPDHGVGMVVLTNGRLANQLVACIAQKLFEVLFGAEERAEAMVASETKALADAAEALRRQIQTDAASTAWIGDLVGDYSCSELGAARISRTGECFTIEVESGFSDLGAAEQSAQSRQIVLTSAGWLGLKLQITDNPNVLLLDAGQTRYEFVRTG